VELVEYKRWLAKEGQVGVLLFVLSMLGASSTLS
jgi:hypothetical protein